MTKFTIDVTDKYLLAALSETRALANAALTPIKDGDGEDLPIETHPQYVATDAAYLTARVIDVLTSYAKQRGYDAEVLAAHEDAATAMRAKMDAVA